MTYRKKLIEVSLPLEAINTASAREKSIRHGHPSTLHLWWARRPLAACRAVLFSSLVDDPGNDLPEDEARHERERLHDIIKALVQWENSNNPRVLAMARREIANSVARNAGVPLPATDTDVLDILRQHAPPVLDPFCGGGSIPLEAQRLGLEAHGSDLNPVAVLITKALIEIPPKFAGRSPVNPVDRARIVSGASWPGATGLAADVRFYGAWMRDEAQQRIGCLYPKVTLPKEHGGGEATVIAWLWARTVTCPNPACGAVMPLLSTFVLSSKKGGGRYLWPLVDGENICFEVHPDPPLHLGAPERGFKRGMSGIFQCAFCGSTTSRDYVAAEGVAHRIGQIQTAIVAQGSRERIYLEAGAMSPIAKLPDVNIRGLDAEFSLNPRDLWCRNFGLLSPADLFTPRQLVALTTFSDLVGEARERAARDAAAAGLVGDGVPLAEGGTGAAAYADAVATYLAMAMDKMADRGSSLCTWFTERDSTRNTFARQALPMTWDFAELNVLLGGTGSFLGAVDWTSESIEGLALDGQPQGYGQQGDATASFNDLSRGLISTDPPYYDNIGYADLSDFFYVWLRRSLRSIHPDLFRTVLVPKAAEMIATPYRFGGSKEKAQQFFEEGFGKAFVRMRAAQDPHYPLTVYYAFKQAESDENDGNSDDAAPVASTGWETMLEGLLKAGFQISGTWPMRSELANRMLASGTNALASSIVLVCRPRPTDAPTTSRRELVAALRRELPDALRRLQHGNIAPVDFAQAAIGPGMAVFSRYARVLESGGQPMRVRTALQIINQELDAFLAEQEGELEAGTRFCIAWFETFGMREAAFGEADVLARAKNTSVANLDAVLVSKAGKVRLLRREDYPDEWDTQRFRSAPTWAATQGLIGRLLAKDQGEEGAARLAAVLGGERAEAALALAYRLYAICDRKRWSEEAQPYNLLVLSWPAIQKRAADMAGQVVAQTGMAL